MPQQLELTCLACGRSFWTRRSYYRHKRDCGRDAGERFGTRRPRITPADLPDEDDVTDPLELDA